MFTDHTGIFNWVCLACNDLSAHPVFYEKSAFIEHLEGRHSRGIKPQQIPMLVSAWQRKTSVSIHSCPLCGFGDQDSDAVLNHTAEHLHSFSLRSLPWAPGEDESDNDLYDDYYEEHPYFNTGRSGGTENEQSRSTMSSEQRYLEELPAVGTGGETTENSRLTEEKIRDILKDPNVEKDMLDAFLNGVENQEPFQEPSPLASVSNLGSVLDSQSKYEEAETMHRWDLEGLEKVEHLPKPEPEPPAEELQRKNSKSISNSTFAEENEETEAHLLEKTYAHELVYKDGQVMGGSLRALIEKLTAHQSTPDAMFVSTFYLTFRLFATPLEFAEALAERFEYIGDTPHAAGPVRLRVYNVFKDWLELHWRHDRDNSALEFIITFAKIRLAADLPTAGKHLLDLADKVSAVGGPAVPRLFSSMGKTNTTIAQYVHPDTPLPPPILGKKEDNLLKQWKTGEASLSILDFDPLELARQLTIKESRIFCSILPEELLDTEWTRKSGSLAVNVRAMSTLSTDLAYLVADSILYLEEPKKRADTIKHWVKISNKCLELKNYDSLIAIICSLNLSMISRLRRTWDVVSQRTKTTLEHLRTIVDVSRNYAVLRQRQQNHVPPCLPFIGTYLTDLTFVDCGNQSHRSLPTDDGEMTVINFHKHMKTARIVSELQRFQIPYRLAEVPELQTWMQNELVRVRSNGGTALQTLYRQSLVLEPREPSRSAVNLQAQAPTSTQSESSPPNQSILENAWDKFDFLSWTHPSNPNPQG